MKKYYETETKKVEIEVIPCIECGSENIELDDCGYSSFNVAWGKCLDCNHEVRISPCGWDITKKKMADKWNTENDPHILRARYLQQMHELRKKLDKLPK